MSVLHNSGEKQMRIEEATAKAMLIGQKIKRLNNIESCEIEIKVVQKNYATRSNA